MHIPLHTISENVLMRPSAITSIPARRRRTVIITAIVIVLAACIPDALKAQSPLPVKDFSVGSQYTYRTTSGTFTEVVLRDTTALGRTYGVVQTFGMIKYLRSDTSSIYEYDPRTNRESTVFQFGQPCAASPGMGWFPQDSACTEVFRTPTWIRYGRYGYRYLSNNVDTYNGQFFEYMKPLGFISYYSENCGSVYSPGHTTRPPQYSGAGWYQSCGGQTLVKLIEAAPGKKLPAQLKLNTTSTSSQTAIYGDRMYITIGVETSYAAFGKLPSQAELQFTIDTTEVSDFQLVIDNYANPKPLYPTSIQQGKAIFQIRLPISQFNFICAIYFRSRAVSQRQQLFSAEIRDAFGSFNVQPASASATHGGMRQISTYLRSYTDSSISTSVLDDSTLKYRQTKIIEVGLGPSLSENIWLQLPLLQMRITLEDLELDSIKIWNTYGNLISSAKTVKQGNLTTYEFFVTALHAVPGWESGARLCTLSVRSNSISQRINRFTFQVISNVAGFSFRPASFELQQLGQKQNNIVITSTPNIFVTAGPNPTTDKVSITFKPDNIGTMTLSLVDATGSVVQSKEIRYFPGYTSADMETSGIQPGMYFLHAALADGTRGTYKIMVIK